jgi:hypothetical protein
MNQDFDSIDDLQPNYPGAQPMAPHSRTWLPRSIACVFIGGHSIIAAIHPVTAIGGVVCAIVALKKYSQDKALYNSNPIAYARSYKYLKAGKTTAIIGLCIAALWLSILCIGIFSAAFNTNNRYDRYDYNDYNYDNDSWENFDDYDY